MITAIIETVTDANGQYGPEKISAVTMADGTQTKVYTKPAAKTIYEALTAGLQVQLTPKSGGAGYLIASIIGEAPASQPPAQNGSKPSPRPPAGLPTAEEIATFIENKSGQVAHAYQALKQNFSAIGEKFTPEIFNSCISTVIISTDKHFNNDAAAWGDTRPVLVAGSKEWDAVVAAIEKHGAGTVDKVVAKARVTLMDETYLREIEKQAIK